MFVVCICVVRLLFVLFGCYLCCSAVICVVRLLFVLFGCYLCCSAVICVVRLLSVLFCVLFVCKCVLPPGDNPTAVNKYIISCVRRKDNNNITEVTKIEVIVFVNRASLSERGS
jgi:hypothetical protein